MLNNKFSDNNILVTTCRVLFCKSCGSFIDTLGLCTYRCEWDKYLPPLRSPASMAYLVYGSTEVFMREEPYGH